MRANRHNPEDVYRSHAEPSLPLFEKFDSPSSQERGPLFQPIHAGSEDFESSATGLVGDTSVIRSRRKVPDAVNENGRGESKHVATGLEGASNGAGLHGCGSAPQVCGGVHTQGQVPSPSASVTSLSSDTGDRPLTGALGSGKPAPSSAIQAHARRTDKQTSHDAAASVRNISKVQSIILNILKNFGPLTDEGISAQYAVCSAWATEEYPRTSPSGLRSRRSDLCKPTKHRPALVEDSGQTAAISTGRQATVWRIVNGGKQ